MATDGATTATYGAEDRVPPATLVLSALQHVAIMAPVGLVFPIVVLGAAANGAEARETTVAASLLALGIASVLFARRGRHLGSGFLAPPVFNGAYVPAGVAAATLGGLPLVMGMMIFGGLCEIGFSYVLRRFRALLPSELAGLTVLMIGFQIGLLGVRQIAGLDGHGAPLPGEGSGAAIGLGAAVLAAIVALNIWARGAARIFAVLIGVAAGYLAAAALGLADGAPADAAARHGLVSLPHLALPLPSFDPTLAPAFVFAGLGAALRTMGDITTCQRIADRHWVRPDFGSIARGVRVDGLATIVSALLGSIGLSTFGASIGLSQATGVMARRVGYAIGAILIAIAFVPPLVAVAAAVPLPVTGAVMMFSSAFVIANGLQIIVARLLDARRVLTIGLALIVGVGHDVYPTVVSGMPGASALGGTSGLLVALAIALALNAAFRIGIGRTAAITVPVEGAALAQIEAFCHDHGARWGAQRDVVRRVFLAVLEAFERAHASAPAGSAFALSLSYDEFFLDATVRFRPDESADAPAEDPIERSLADLPLAMIRRHADSVEVGQVRGDEVIRMRFDA